MAAGDRHPVAPQTRPHPCQAHRQQVAAHPPAQPARWPRTSRSGEAGRPYQRRGIDELSARSGAAVAADARLVRQRQPVLSADEPYRRAGFHRHCLRSSGPRPERRQYWPPTPFRARLRRAGDQAGQRSRPAARGHRPQHGRRRHPLQPSAGYRYPAAAVDFAGARLCAPALRHGGTLRLLHPVVRCGGQGD